MPHAATSSQHLPEVTTWKLRQSFSTGSGITHHHTLLWREDTPEEDFMGKYTGKKAVVTGGTFERPDAAGEHLIQDRGAGADEAGVLVVGPWHKFDEAGHRLTSIHNGNVATMNKI
ncbi:MAG TPA: hypothetical protein VFA32_00815 [Dehalococcoidia bacterium]|nr:hypothetical protein [Dehalococcoidia bacterium]